jgi:hypothetical protein
MRGALAWSVGTALLACGGATSTDEAGQDGSALRTCTIPAGTYSETFVVGAGGVSCPSIPARTVTIAENEAITGSEVTTGDGSFGLFDAGTDCTSAADSTTCTFTTTCTTTTDGSTSNTSISVAFNGNSATGQESTKSTDSMGKVLSTCNYDITATIR